MTRKKWTEMVVAAKLPLALLPLALVFTIAVASCDLVPYETWSPSSKVITLTAGVWANGNIPTSSGVQWFKFTATTSLPNGRQFIHVNFGTLNDLHVQLYDSTGTQMKLYFTAEYPRNDEANLFYFAADFKDTYTQGTVTSGQVYFIKVWPEPQNPEYDSSGSGTYQITYNTSSTPPDLSSVWPPISVTELTEAEWANGNITTAGGVQWFSFTATTSATLGQYIHVTFGTLSDFYVQLYNSSGTTVGTQTEMWSTTRYISRTVTAGQTYYIKVSPYYSYGSGNFQITFNKSSTRPGISIVWPPTSVTELTETEWANGNITTAGGEQWFKFTATTSTTLGQYIHVTFGSLNDLYVQLYNSSGTTVGVQTEMYGSTRYISRTVTAGQTYYIKVWPYSSTGSGNFQITFNTSSTRPNPPIGTWTPPGVEVVDIIELTVSVWADGNILTSSEEQWFKFTATASSHYFHVKFGTLDDLYAQLYDSFGYTVGVNTNFFGTTSSMSRSATVGQTYYIRVKPETGESGDYKIVFSTSSATPALPITLPTNNVTDLTVDVWADGDIIAVAPREQWFKFEATAATQYIHVNFGTLNDLYVQLYNSSGYTVGTQTEIYSARFISRPVTVGQTYYIKVSPYSSTGSGTYKIVFNDSNVTWTPPAVAPADITDLTVNVWANGNIATSGGEQWFRFTAPSTTSSQYIHFNLGTLTNLSVQLYNGDDSSIDGSTVGIESTISSNTSIYRSVRLDHAYYIKVSSSGTGTYQIVFSSSSTRPALPITLPTDGVTDLTVATWASGNIATSGGEQWFRFTATATTQYIHINFGTLNDLYVQLYNSSSTTVGTQTEMWSTIRYASRTVTAGQTYYIRVWPYYSTGSGNYKIAFNTSITAPGGL